MALAVMGIGFLIALVGGLWLLVEGFKESVVWGLLMLFIGPVGLVFALMHWDKGGKPLLINLGGCGLMFVGALLGGPPPA